MATSVTTAKPPEPLNQVDREHRGEHWRRFKRDWTYYELSARIHKEDPKIRVASLLNVIGSEAVDMFDSFKFDSEAHADDIDIVLQKFDERLMPERNETYDSYMFFHRVQEPSETIEQYVVALQKKSEFCNFGELRERLIRDQFVSGIRDKKMQEKLLGKKNLTLAKAIEMAKAAVVTHSRASEMAPEVEVHSIKKTGKPKDKAEVQQEKSYKAAEGRKKNFGKCRYCGREHSFEKGNCPAADQKCHVCGIKGHFAIKCRKKKEKVNEVEQIDNVEDVQYILSCDEREYASCVVNGQRLVRLQIDTGAGVNILPMCEYIQVTGDVNCANLEKCTTRLVMHNKTEDRPIGAVNLDVQRNNKRATLKFLIVKDSVTPLIGLKSCKQLELIRIVDSDSVNKVEEKPQSESVEFQDEILKKFSDVFQGIGCLEGEYHLEVDPDVKPVAHQPRRYPAAKLDALKTNLDQMVRDGIIEPLGEQSTKWVSSCLPVDKPDGSLRITMDPKDLNKAILRSQLLIPTIEEIATNLNKAKIFTVVDAYKGFWHITSADGQRIQHAYHNEHTVWTISVEEVSHGPQSGTRNLPAKNE